jgi:hypothetical protein
VTARSRTPSSNTRESLPRRRRPSRSRPSSCGARAADVRQRCAGARGRPAPGAPIVTGVPCTGGDDANLAGAVTARCRTEQGDLGLVYGHGLTSGSAELSVLPTRIPLRSPACSFVVQLTRLWFRRDCRAVVSCIRKQARSGDVEGPPQRRGAGSDQEVRVRLVQASILAVPGPAASGSGRPAHRGGAVL